MSPKKIKVCHFEASVGQGRGEYFVDLANAQARWGSDFKEVILVSPVHANYLLRVDSNVRHVPYRSKGSRNNLLLLWELYNIFKKEKPDIVHTHFNKATKIYSRLSLLLSSSWVATKHNSRPASIYKKTPHVIAVSEAVSNSLVHQGVTVIHNGIDSSKNHAPPIHHPSFIINMLAIGRLEKVKGFDRLIETLKHINVGLEWQLSIVGEGSERAALEQQIKVSGLEDKIKLLGFREDVTQLMRNNDLVIVSSHSEGFCLVLLEALLHSPLVVSTPVGIAKEALPKSLILPEENFGSRLAEVLNTYDSLHEQLNLIRKATIERFSIENAVMKHLELYLTILTDKEIMLK